MNYKKPILNIFSSRYSGNNFLGNFHKIMASSSSTKLNRLQFEKSPYLLQHKANPVDWYPWGEEAFELAKSQNKPIFLSVGYSTCHWCHVMERESFENEEVAKVMNEKFINIKMDREERPDIDKIYMTFVQAISGSGGWPMSVWMTPCLKPIYGGTYYPPDNRYYGRPGFKSLLETIFEQWDDNEEKCHESGNKILEVLNRSASLPTSVVVTEGIPAASKCLQQLTRTYEPSFGGFSEHPKFPQPVNLLFLMDWAVKNLADSNRFSVVKMVETTLTEMAKGGIHDHIGQGFARYSTDKKWHVPHFEKMLYDQAQLAVAYANAYLLTKQEFYAEIVRDILKYVGRDLSHPDGGFYSAEDADSHPTFDSKEKKEGAFYVWKESEIDEILGDKQLSNGKAKVADVFKLRYGVKHKGNVDPFQDPHDELKEQNVLFEATSITGFAKKFELPESEIKYALDEARTILFNYRNTNRPRPGLDFKFVTSWMGLMISGYARSGLALDFKEYIDRAEKAMGFLVKHVFKSDDKGGFDLLRSCYRDDENGNIVNLKTPIYGCVDDFCNLVAASIDLFEATGEVKYLQQAIKLQAKQDDLFWDEEIGGYFTSRKEDPYTIVRMKDDDDGAEPSSNSTSVVNLIRLHSLLQEEKYSEKIEKLLKQFSDRISKIPITLPMMTAALTSYEKGPVILVRVHLGESSSSSGENLKTLLPVASVIIDVNAKNRDATTQQFPLVKQIVSVPDNSDKTFFIKGKDAPVLVKSSQEIIKLLS